MRIILKSLHMENFKGIKSLEVNFSNKTSIKGQNAAGKTTIFDAFTWLLFNKNSAGEEKFNIRPLDKDGNRIDNVEIKVVGVLDVEGKESKVICGGLDLIADMQEISRIWIMQYRSFRAI